MRTHLSLPAIGFALIWIAAALLVEGTTFHLAPVIVAAAPAVRFPEWRVPGAAAGTAVAITVAVLLSVTGSLNGPSLLPIGGALFESIVAAVTGGIVGLVVASTGLFDARVGEPA